MSALPSVLDRGKCLYGRAIINLFIDSTVVQILVGTVVLRMVKQGFICFCFKSYIVNAMILTLIRDEFTPAETLGKLYIDHKFVCDTLEPPVVPNARHPKGCIPQGWYNLSVTNSPHFGRLLPLLHMVPGFEGIRIHAGNNREHTEGCILVGERSPLPDSFFLYSSKKTEQTIVNILLKAQKDHEQIFIDISDTAHYADECAAVARLSEYANCR